MASSGKGKRGRQDHAARAPLRRAARAGGRFASSIAIVAGILLIAEAAITVLWQEPITALIASRSQSELNEQLDVAEAATIEVGTPIRGYRDPRLVKTVRERKRAAALANARQKLKRRARKARLRTPVGKALGRIKIPKIGASFAMVNGTDPGSLEKGPGHYVQTSLPGERGTFAVAGHRTTYLAPFRNIDDLKPGDEIRIEMPYGKFRYEVEKTRIVSPDATHVLGKRQGHPRIVLTACHPLYSAAKRIVVFGRIAAGPLGERS